MSKPSDFASKMAYSYVAPVEIPEFAALANFNNNNNSNKGKLRINFSGDQY
jgi:hypothetical protein